jgi:hypothetical protein
MKRALPVLLIVVVALFVVAFRAPNLIRDLESRAVAGDWQAARTLADWYDADAYFSWAGVRQDDAPVSLRVCRTFQRSEATARYWSTAAFNLLVQAAAENDRRALLTLGWGVEDLFGAGADLSDERRDDYLVRLLLSDGPAPDVDAFAYGRLVKRNPNLAESIRREAARSGLLWPALLTAKDAASAGEWDRWMEVWADALGRGVPGARPAWIRDRSRLLDEVDSGNGASIALLERIRAFDRAHPDVGLLGT